MSKAINISSKASTMAMNMNKSIDESGSDDGTWSIFPLTDNLSGSYVDPSKLILSMSQSNAQQLTNPIGMANFKSKLHNRAKFTNSLPSAANANKNFAFFYNSASNNSYLNVARMRWKSAAGKARHLNDPWAEFKLDAFPAETVIRHRYNAIKKMWITDECIVKMENEEFARGAMRACFRL